MLLGKLSYKQLSQLVGLKFWKAGYVANMLWIGIGPKKYIISRGGKKKLVSKFALHVSCGWRVLRESIVLTGSMVDAPECDLNKLAERYGEMVIESVSADNYGGAILYFKNGLSIELIPLGPIAFEQWRLFNPDNLFSRHFVVGGIT